MLTLHHIGILVKDIQFSIEQYKRLFGENKVSPIHHIRSQQVNVCFVDSGNGSKLELVEPVGDDSPVSKLLNKRTSYYHIGYTVEDLEKTVSTLEALNYKPLQAFRSEAFNGGKCIFLFTPEAHLIELIEIS